MDICVRNLEKTLSDLITIFTNIDSSRWQYTKQFVFDELLGLAVEIASKPTTSDISYVLSGGKLSIPSMGLLSDKATVSIEKIETLLHDCHQWVLGNTKAIPDIFSAIFWYLSRMEEYATHGNDKYQRFASGQSLAQKYHHFPLVDMIVDKLTNVIQQNCPNAIIHRKKKRHRSTLDIDKIWAFAHQKEKVFLGAVKSILKRDWKTFDARVKSFLSAYDDPFFTFVEIEKWHEESGIVPEYFVLSSTNEHPFDENHPIDDAPARIIIRGLDRGNNMGLHPSYASNEKPELIIAEKNKLEQVLEHSIEKSRQHYLKLSLPSTYHNLSKAGISSDHSMGYPDMIGYRAGTGHDFYWYDLETEKTTLLRIYPLIAMDVTLKDYMGLSPAEALDKVASMIKFANEINSPFTLLWHNSSLSAYGGWESWPKVYQQLLQKLASKE